ncbi:MAG TPA: hypothetical protein VG013_19650 [Gemmataceae bacterium]|jgi:hypothetical protein|nr:hypothetical protein [Gemmataceae bacterium]
MGIKESVGQAIGDALERSRQHLETIIESRLMRGEKVVAFQLGETKAPFLIRIIPVIGALFGRAKIYLIATTDRRILIIRLSRSLTKGHQFKELTASVPFSELDGVEPSTGMLTSSITIRTKAGQAYHFVDMLKSAAEAFARDVGLAARAFAAGTSKR